VETICPCAKTACQAHRPRVRGEAGRLERDNGKRRVSGSLSSVGGKKYSECCPIVVALEKSPTGFRDIAKSRGRLWEKGLKRAGKDGSSDGIPFDQTRKEEYRSGVERIQRGRGSDGGSRKRDPSEKERSD